MSTRLVIRFAMVATVVAVAAAGAVWYTSQSDDRGQPGQACITDQELLGNVAAGFWIAQRIQAERCDRYFKAVGSEGQAHQADMHTAILAKFQTDVKALKSWETASFTRRYGEMAETVHRQARLGYSQHHERQQLDYHLLVRCTEKSMVGKRGWLDGNTPEHPPAPVQTGDRAQSRAEKQIPPAV